MNAPSGDCTGDLLSLTGMQTRCFSNIGQLKYSFMISSLVGMGTQYFMFGSTASPVGAVGWVELRRSALEADRDEYKRLYEKCQAESRSLLIPSAKVPSKFGALAAQPAIRFLCFL